MKERKIVKPGLVAATSEKSPYSELADAIMNSAPMEFKQEYMIFANGMCVEKFLAKNEKDAWKYVDHRESFSNQKYELYVVQKVFRDQ